MLNHVVNKWLECLSLLPTTSHIHLILSNIVVLASRFTRWSFTDAYHHFCVSELVQVMEKNQLFMSLEHGKDRLVPHERYFSLVRTWTWKWRTKYEVTGWQHEWIRHVHARFTSWRSKPHPDKQRWISCIKFVYLYFTSKQTKNGKAPSFNLWNNIEWKNSYTSSSIKKLLWKIFRVLSKVHLFAYKYLTVYKIVYTEIK
jgi:hypothetical protein